MFSLNTRAQFFVAREAYKHLNKGGRIILMSSNTAHSYSVPRHSLYSASKGAIETFVRCLAKDTGDKKITINAVAPGGTVTDMFHATSEHYIPNGAKYTAEERQHVSELILDSPRLQATEVAKRACTDSQQMAALASPLERNGFPLDVARVVAFLASNESEWINGKSICLDGGAA